MTVSISYLCGVIYPIAGGYLPRNARASTVVKAFLSRWLAIIGALFTIMTDRGAQFDCTCVRTTAYHLTANWMVEWFHRQLKVCIRAAADRQNWMDDLPLVLLGIRSFLNVDLDCSTAGLVLDANL
ncbi:unnamed protein product [Dibothriocephalus latus]|uniref:Integrase catalytic domain-containing protein n=1 Tax=Dibothriocephalus latus TaxID=60516 RepID=A0A3P6NZT9_DIBLA|nr:unnamed protein product [Dibothriocephalus latus]